MPAQGANADIITAEDLPKLRLEMIGYADDVMFSDEFRRVCSAVVTAIDLARDDDEATHAALENALNAFVASGNAEQHRCDRLIDFFNRIADAKDTVTMPRLGRNAKKCRRMVRAW